jgi:hypothetical protein
MGLGIRPRGCGHLRLSLYTPWQIPTFHTEACDGLMSPVAAGLREAVHRLPRGP